MFDIRIRIEEDGSGDGVNIQLIRLQESTFTDYPMAIGAMLTELAYALHKKTNVDVPDIMLSSMVQDSLIEAYRMCEQKGIPLISIEEMSVDEKDAVVEGITEILEEAKQSENDMD